MRVAAFSDTHGLHRELQLPKCDMLLFCGDCMTCGYKRNELIDFLDWFEKCDAKYKIMIAGNHDRFIQNHPFLFEEMLVDYPSINYLENSGINIEGINIWGTPDQRIFLNWAFNRTDNQLKIIFDYIPTNTNILISHAPALGIGDMLENKEQVGELALRDKIEELHDLKFHVFGHIHNDYDEYHIGRYVAYNCSVVNERYELQNEPIVFDYLLNRVSKVQVSDTTGDEQRFNS
jgi:Icc-related predicted phosphoesterase